MVSMSVPLGFSIFAILLGLILGSFGNVLIYRLPKEKSIGGRSYCPHCKRTLGIIDLIPVVSFVLLRARCRTCRKPISWQYPLVELSSGFLFLYALQADLVAAPSFAVGVLSALLLGLCLWLLLLIALTDAKTALIPDALNIPFLVFSLLHGYINGLDLITPAVIGSGFFAAQWVISRGRWVGTGDIVLAAGIGAFLGSVPLLLLALWIAYVSGAIVAVILLIHKKKTMQSRLAFGPFLVGGACVAFVWGEQIVRLVGL